MMECLGIFLVALAGGLVPLAMRWSDRGLHLALAMSTGIFLGAVFLHLLPELAMLQADHARVEAELHALEGVADPGPADPAAGAPQSEDHDHDHDHDLDDIGAAGHVHGASADIWFFVLVGVLAVYLIESLMLRTHDHDDLHRHRAVGFAALAGLSIHALTAGVGFAVVSANTGLAGPVLLAILCHKGFESFSLTSVFQLAQFTRARILLLVILFSLVTPAGLLLGNAITHNLTGFGTAVFTALAAGTFLFVCLCELLPEVFHHREDIVAKILLLCGGIAVMALVHRIGV